MNIAAYFNTPQSLGLLATVLQRGLNTWESPPELLVRLSDDLHAGAVEPGNKCDGNHGGPRCADPECWNDSPPASDPLKDNQIAALVNKVCRLAREFHNHDSLRQRIAQELVPALKPTQQHAEPVEEPGGVPLAWQSTREGLVAYVLQDDLHNRLTPRVIDIAYSAFMSGRRGKNKDDGGPCDWFNDTKPLVLEAIERIRSDLAKARPAPSASTAWPKTRDVGRFGDMHPMEHMRVGLDSDNDVYVSVWGEDGGASVEFCNPGGGGGGSSRRTREALIALMVAMEADNAERPDKDWWARRNGTAQAKGGAA